MGYKECVVQALFVDLLCVTSDGEACAAAIVYSHSPA